MKKILSFLFILFALTSCFGNNDEKKLEDAKNELLHGKVETGTGIVTDSSDNTQRNDTTVSQNQNEPTDMGQPHLEIKYITSEEFIKLDPLSAEDFSDMQQEIRGTTLVSVDKITVLFKNPTSNLPDGKPYTLKQFKPGDATFLFRAFKKYNTLDYGENTYIFTAYSGQKKSELELKVYIPDPSKKPPVEIGNLPSSSVFGNPIQLGNGKVGYSDIKGLEITNVGNIDVTNDAESITAYLKNHYNGYFYWNTPRFIRDKNGVSFYVISQKNSKDENYMYEKHYYNGNGIYGILPLATGQMDGKTLKEKNIELKETNDSYPLTKVADTLFLEITR